MTLKISILLLLTLLESGQIISQNCETYNRKLFHGLPMTFPDTVNCKDKFGKKNGWWIYSDKIFHAEEDFGKSSKEIDDIVGEYTYGQYSEDRKIGTWITINNKYILYPTLKETYYYNQDTFRLTTWKPNGVTNLTYINNNTTIKFSYLDQKEKFPICINCRKKTKTCFMTYRNKTIKKFSFENFDLESEKAPFMYGRDKKMIDAKYE